MSEARAERAPVVISPMRRRHLPSVLRIEKQVYPRPWTMGLYLGELALSGTRTYVVARRGGTIMGYGGMMLLLDEAHVTTVAVDPGAQGAGIGTRIMLVVAHKAILRGARSLTLEVRMGNKAAQELYRKFGFAPAGVRKGYYPSESGHGSGEDAVVMWAHDIDDPSYRERLDRIELATGVAS